MIHIYGNLWHILVNDCYIQGEQTLMISTRSLKKHWRENVFKERGGVNNVWWCQKGGEIKEKETYQKQNYKLLKDLKIKWMN